jgi:hypothetical protein
MSPLLWLLSLFVAATAGMVMVTSSMVLALGIMFVAFLAGGLHWAMVSALEHAHSSGPPR